MSKSTLKYIGKRLLISVVTLFVILVVLFLIVKLLPGSPINNERLSEAQRAAIEARYGLDQPVLTQFVNYVKNMLTGDFGVSYNMYKDMPVSSLVGSAAKISFLYGLSAVVIGGIFGTLLGVFAALHKNTIWDTLATVISVIGVSVPSFVFAMMILILFASKLHIFPTQYSSMNPIGSSIMPVMALSVGVIANVARFTRTEMVSVINSEYMTLAEAKGLDSKTLIFKHALRNALIPVVTILGPILVNLMTGTMVVEKICGVPGLGKLLINSILSNDVNIILACSFLYAAMYIVMMLIIDVSYGIIDPRIRLGKEDS
ncbi:ABC transporter permease [Massilimicrobiota timonensis]|uniref:ABC transporter permease n=1 Tax=Massilimicrobiota timonensis TaxID=1776392 RepID=UPI001961BD6D|nr:ABC transporter permease [Massilimicrobiota timonensis]MBM6966044.1 ABC transporter permease [Massilimicrobiota timonensis]